MKTSKPNRLFIDERYPNHTITEAQLRFEYSVNYGDPSENPYPNFESFLDDCLGKNGTLKEL